VIVQRDISIQHRKQQVATLFLLGFIVLMVLLKNVIRVIFAKVKPPIKPLAFLDPTPPKKDPLRALNVHPGRMPILSVPYLAKIVATMHTNQNPMLRNAFQCKRVITNQDQQPKSSAQRVKQDVVATQHVKIVKLGRINIFPATPRAVTAPVDLATKPKVPRHAMLSLLDPTVGTVKCVNVKQVIFALAKPQTKLLVVLGRMQPDQNQFHVLNAHLARMPILLVPQLAKSVATMHTNPNLMLRNAFR
jgi:hypothetical protein